MTLTPGTRLGPYEIFAPLGSGGMGEVYRAKDTRLGREVAVKVLPQHLSANTEVRTRFEREAKTISSLNHPHICTLFDVGREGDTDYLVMELVEGETLAQRLAKGALPAAEVLRLGAQIADALDRAHRAGVIHRDLKPGNVMLAKSGAKLMDFGLARASVGTGPTSGSGSVMATLTQSPTMVSPLTAEGTIVGTFQYMAPEQLEGNEADARADLWALGCVLHEMATGRRAFDGRSQASLITSIMSSEPALVSSLAPAAPPELDRVVRGCLAKDAADRIQSAHDVRLQLQWLAEQGSLSGSFAGTPAARARPAAGREPLAWGVAALFAAAALVAGSLGVRGGGGDVRVLRATLTMPADVALAITGDDAGPPALSPDGRMLAFGAAGRGSGLRIWLRSLDELSVRPLPGTEGGAYPFWSPDGRSLGFFADGDLKRIDLAGGAVLRLCDANNGRGGTWSRDGVIVFAADWVSALFQVAASGGAPSPVTTLDSLRGETTHRWPLFMPDGKHFLYLAANHAAADTSAALWFASLDGRVRRRLMSSPSNAVFASDRLLFVRDSTLLAQRFDPNKGRLIGAPMTTREIVQFDATTWRAMVTASESGVLVYGPGGNQGAFRVTQYDRSGRVLGTLGTAGNHFCLRLSPDGSRAVVEIQHTPNADLWIYNLSSGAGTRIAAHPADDSQPSWSPDGTQIAFATHRDGKQYRVDAVRANGSAPPQVLVDDPAVDIWVLQWIEGGRALLAGRGSFQDGQDDELWLHPLDGRAPRLLIPASTGCAMAQLSADGRWLAYDSRVSGRQEVYVMPMPRAGTGADSLGAGGRWQVSAEGGNVPMWSRDGRELFYKRLDDVMTAVTVDGRGESFRVESERPLFQAFQRGFIPTYDVSADGSRFMVVTSSTERQAPLVVVTNWTRTLNAR